MSNTKIPIPKSFLDDEEAYRRQLKRYRMSDARIHTNDYLEENNLTDIIRLSDEDYETMVEMYEDQEDANVPENTTWENVVTKYLLDEYNVPELSEQYLKQSLAVNDHTLYDEIRIRIGAHIKKYQLYESQTKTYKEPRNICAYYTDIQDFYKDWCEQLQYTKEEADALLNSDTGEFMILPDNTGIIRFAS